MKYSTKLSDTVHVMVLIAINQENPSPVPQLQKVSIQIPGFVRQLMLKLKKRNL